MAHRDASTLKRSCPAPSATSPHRARSSGWLALALALLSACLYEDDPYYCPGQPNNYCASDGAQPCSSSEQCGGATPLCDVQGSGTCVQCTAVDAAACSGTSPVCGSDQQCRGCASHAECASALCLPDGSCADTRSVAYVSAQGSDNPDCTATAPCRRLAAALATGRPQLKLRGVLDEALVVDGGRQLSVFAAPAARLTTSAGAAIITVRDSGTALKVYDLTIADAPNAGNGIGVLVPSDGGTPTVELVHVVIDNNPGGGVIVNGGSLVVARSTISNNRGGGISATGFFTSFAVTDSVIVYNGRALGPQRSIYGGVVVSANQLGSRFERNTVAFNESSGDAFRGGLSCSAPSAAATGNIIYHNMEPDGAGGLVTSAATQTTVIVGGCVLGNSLVLAAEPGNLGFRSPLLPPLDFHLTAATPTTVRDAGGACSGPDLDGDPRPLGGACDLGADEYQR